MVGVEDAHALAGGGVVAHLDALERVQRDLRAELHALAEDDLAAVHRVEQAVVADRRVVADPHRSAAQLDARARAERDAVAELERVVRRRPDVEDLAAAELDVLAEAQRQRAGLAAVGMDLDGRQLVEVRAVRRLEREPAAGAAQARVQAPRPDLEARALGREARVRAVDRRAAVFTRASWQRALGLRVVTRPSSGWPRRARRRRGRVPGPGVGSPAAQRTRRSRNGCSTKRQDSWPRARA